MLRFLSKAVATLSVLAVCGVLAVVLAVTLVYPSLPNLDALINYQPNVPLRIQTADGVLLGEFGEERRNVVRIQEVPDILKAAILSAEDDAFYRHRGVDLRGVARAALVNLSSGERAQGASTITMQVARNFYLTSEKTWTRKLFEVLLTFKIEAELSKDQILELYMNQIFMGHRSYGFASAARTYFGKSLSELTIAEAAMLAGVPKAPSRFNPITNAPRAQVRQAYVLRRMHELGYITTAELEQARAEPLRLRERVAAQQSTQVHGEYVAELVRLLIQDLFGDETYTRGLVVTTTILSDHQAAAWQSVRDGVFAYERRRRFRGPEGRVDLPAGLESDTERFNALLDNTLSQYPDSDDLLAAVVLSATPEKVVVARSAREIIEISGNGLRFASRALAARAAADLRIERGSVVRILERDDRWEILQMPEVEAAFVSADHQTGAIRALIGGFDFQRSKFNHVTQAWRQPGSSFKPFIYAPALERGLTPSTLISDDPFVLEASQTGSTRWEPRNYDGEFGAPMTMREAMAKSKNMPSIRILESVGPQEAQAYLARFGFSPERHPAFLTMALGAGSVTPLQMLEAYGVFANGGYLVPPFLIQEVRDHEGRVLMQARPQPAGTEALRTLDPRTAFVSDSLLQEVMRSGTGASARRIVQRDDMAGKTGTTNDARDAWFAGYAGNLVGVAWVGFSQPRSLGERETGGGSALPIWANYMRHGLRDVPPLQRTPPAGLIRSGGDYYYREFPPGQAVATLGIAPPEPTANLWQQLFGAGPGTNDAPPPSQMQQAPAPIEHR